MWPWGHLAVGYLLYSPAVHLLRGRAPGAVGVLALALGTQLPDLVDKPLSWVFHLTPQGYSVAHSVFVAVPVGIAVVALAAEYGRIEVGGAFTVGYWSHLVADVVFAVALREPYAVERVLWPLVVLPPYSSRVPPLARVFEYADRWVEYLLATAGAVGLAVYVAPLVAAGLLWLYDGAPGLPRPRQFR